MGLEGDGIRYSVPSEALRILPSCLSETLRAIYSSKCREHHMQCVTTTHLRDEHGLDIDLPRLLRSYQLERNRLDVKRKLKDTTEYCLAIRHVNAPRLGRPVGRGRAA